MELSLITYSKLNRVTYQRNVAIALLLIISTASIAYGVYQYNREQKRL